MDSIDADDVEFMLGSVASPSAPTPAIPRILRTKSDDDPHTPSRPGFLPSRANLSYQSPAAPSSTDNSPFLRPKARHPGNDRGSILSWEQLAQHSKSLDDEDVEKSDEEDSKGLKLQSCITRQVISSRINYKNVESRD